MLKYQKKCKKKNVKKKMLKKKNVKKKSKNKKCPTKRKFCKIPKKKDQNLSEKAWKPTISIYKKNIKNLVKKISRKNYLIFI